MCNCASSGGLVRGGQEYPDCDLYCIFHQRYDKAKKNLKQYRMSTTNAVN